MDLYIEDVKMSWQLTISCKSYLCSMLNLDELLLLLMQKLYESNSYYITKNWNWNLNGEEMDGADAVTYNVDSKILKADANYKKCKCKLT